MRQKTIVCIGEMLWDIFPDKKKEGGSSMNVSLNLNKQGIHSKLISAVGDDQNGKDLLNFLQLQNFPTDLIQQSELPTSTVQVNIDKDKQASYTIAKPVAWDAIDLTNDAIRSVKNADAFLYCSLTCRSEKSRTTILELVKHAQLKIFDINLRPPYYTITIIKALLNEADILKINEDELLYLKPELSLTGITDEQLLKQISLQFNIETICFTIGQKGAYVWHQKNLYHHKGYPTKVADTVGAGDSFLATFVASYLNDYPMDIVLDRACKVGAFVASKHGANPTYGKDIFN